MNKKHDLIAILILLILVALCLPSNSVSIIRTIDGTAIYVFDGDTMKIKTKEGRRLKVRLAFYDAPERVRRDRKTGRTIKLGQPYGEESFKALMSKVLGKKVRVAIIDIDEYKRMVGVVYLGGRNINIEMLEEGYGWAYRKYLKGKPYAPEYLNAEKEARRQQLGLWQQANPIPPWKFKRLQ